MRTAYRIIEVKNGLPHTLFHGLNGSRRLPVNKWLRACNKMVRDGTGPYYEGGFNVIFSRTDCVAYLQRFSRPRDLRVVKIKVDGRIRKKEHSPSPVFLADLMLLPEQEIK